MAKNKINKMVIQGIVFNNVTQYKEASTYQTYHLSVKGYHLLHHGQELALHIQHYSHHHLHHIPHQQLQFYARIANERRSVYP